MNLTACDSRNIACALQWGLLTLWTLLIMAALFAGWRDRGLRPMAFAVSFTAWTHAVYYVLFLAFPDVLDARRTMLFSIILRYQVLFTFVAALVLVARRGERWKK